MFDSCCDPSADPIVALRMNKVAKIRWAYIRLSYLLLLYFPQHRETFINLEIYPAAELRSCYVYSNALSLSLSAGLLGASSRTPSGLMSAPPLYKGWVDKQQ